VFSNVTSFESVLAESANSRVVPIYRKVFASTETPLTIFEKLANGVPGSFLLESAEQGVWSRFSFIGIHVRGILVQNQDSELSWKSQTGSTPLPNDQNAQLSTDPLTAISQIVEAWKSEASTSEFPLTSGLVGNLGWDLIRDLEKLPRAKSSDIVAPRVHLAMIKDLVIVDHLDGSVTFVSNIFVEGQTDAVLSSEYSAALASIDEMLAKLAKPTKPYIAEVDFASDASVVSNLEENEFNSMVNRAKEHVVAGDVFQVVLSQRFKIDNVSKPLDVYRMLRAMNPSPYMYLLNGMDEGGEFAIVGSSPESLVTVTKRDVITHPIAGSRPRGTNWADDQNLEDELLADTKEKAEHLMLVDLARNDLLKVCDSSSVEVSEFMQVHRFSHIMHLVSTVGGKLLEGKNAIDVFRATFPAGTLSGAPKPRALEIISELEPTERGIYGGVCGYFDFAGNSDLAIAIRTAFVRNGVATVQAGAGIVLDSVPTTEFQETVSKAKAVVRAIAAANTAKQVND